MIYGWSTFNMLSSADMLSVCDPDSWLWPKDFIKNHDIYVMFSDNYNSEYIYYFKYGLDFFDTYPQWPFLEFYITDLQSSYLIGYNNSACLLTMGSAIEWLENDSRYIEFIKNYYESK